MTVEPHNRVARLVRSTHTQVPSNAGASLCGFNAPLGSALCLSRLLRLPAFCPDPCRWRRLSATTLAGPPRTTITPPLLLSQLSSRWCPGLTETPVRRSPLFFFYSFTFLLSQDLRYCLRKPLLTHTCNIARITSSTSETTCYSPSYGRPFSSIF